MYIVCYASGGKLNPKFKFDNKDNAYEYAYDLCSELLSGWCTCDKKYLFKCLDKENSVTIYELARHCYCAYPYTHGVIIIDTERIKYHDSKI